MLNINTLLDGFIEAHTYSGENDNQLSSQSSNLISIVNAMRKEFEGKNVWLLNKAQDDKYFFQNKNVSTNFFRENKNEILSWLGESAYSYKSAYSSVDIINDNYMTGLTLDEGAEGLFDNSSAHHNTMARLAQGHVLLSIQKLFHNHLLRVFAASEQSLPDSLIFSIIYEYEGLLKFYGKEHTRVASELLTMYSMDEQELYESEGVAGIIDNNIESITSFLRANGDIVNVENGRLQKDGSESYRRASGYVGKYLNDRLTAWQETISGNETERLDYLYLHQLEKAADLKEIPDDRDLVSKVINLIGGVDELDKYHTTPYLVYAVDFYKKGGMHKGVQFFREREELCLDIFNKHHESIAEFGKAQRSCEGKLSNWLAWFSRDAEMPLSYLLWGFWDKDSAERKELACVIMHSLSENIHYVHSRMRENEAKS